MFNRRHACGNRTGPGPVTSPSTRRRPRDPFRAEPREQEQGATAAPAGAISALPPVTVAARWA